MAAILVGRPVGWQACRSAGLWDGRHVGRQAHGMGCGRMACGIGCGRKASGMAGMLEEADLSSGSERADRPRSGRGQII